MPEASKDEIAYPPAETAMELVREPIAELPGSQQQIEKRQYLPKQAMRQPNKKASWQPSRQVHPKSLPECSGNF